MALYSLQVFDKLINEALPTVSCPTTRGILLLTEKTDNFLMGKLSRSMKGAKKKLHLSLKKKNQHSKPETG